MNSKVAFLFAAALALPAWAQPIDDSAERARIAEERARVEAEFEKAHKACYARFAVNDCIADARAIRREQMADLRRQELALNDADRRRRGAERLSEIESRSQQRGQPDGSPAPAPQESAAPGSEAPRAVAPPARDAASAVAKPPRRSPQSPPARAPRSAERPDAQENARRYNERLQKAQEHKAKVEKQAAENEKKDVRPLPVPP